MKTITIIILVAFICIFIIPTERLYGAGGKSQEKLNLLVGIILGSLLIMGIVLIVKNLDTEDSCILFSSDSENYYNDSLCYQPEEKTVTDFNYQEYQTDVLRGNNKSMTVLSLSF